MTLAELRERPTTVAAGGHRVHESVLRSYALVEKIRSLLMSDQPCPPKVLLEIIDDVHDAPHVDHKFGGQP